MKSLGKKDKICKHLKIQVSSYDFEHQKWKIFFFIYFSCSSNLFSINKLKYFFIKLMINSETKHS